MLNLNYLWLPVSSRVSGHTIFPGKRVNFLKTTLLTAYSHYIIAWALTGNRMYILIYTREILIKLIKNRWSSIRINSVDVSSCRIKENCFIYIHDKSNIYIYNFTQFMFICMSVCSNWWLKPGRYPRFLRFFTSNYFL